MSFFTNLWQDLVEKRLVPVLAVLVVALVAVPLVLGRGGGSDTVEAPLPVADTGATAVIATPAVAVDESTKVDSGGDPTNPFVQQHVPKPPKTETTPQEPPAESKPAPEPKPKPDDKDDKDDDAVSENYKVAVRFGEPGVTKPRTLNALTPLPKPDETFVVFLGVKGGKTAVFLVSTDAKATGDGKCVPSETTCQKVEMIKGDTELFDVSDETGSAVKQYELELVSIKRA